MFICWYLTLFGDNKEIKMSEEKPIPNSVKFAIGGLSGFVLMILFSKCFIAYFQIIFPVVLSILIFYIFISCFYNERQVIFIFCLHQ